MAIVSKGSGGSIKFSGTGGSLSITSSGGGGGGGFNPSSLGNLSAWYKADSLSLSNGATVTSIADSSGTGNDMTSYGGTPIYNASDAQFGGKPSISLNGSSSYLYKDYAAGLPVGSEAWTIYVVGYTSSNTLFGIGGNSNGRAVRVSLAGDSGSGAYYADYCNIAPGGPAYGSTSSPVVLSISKPGGAWPANLLTLVSFYCNNVLGTPGGEGYEGSLPPQNGGPGVTPAYTTIGCIPGAPAVGFGYGVGKFAESLVYNTQHDNTARLQVTQYLASKYGISI